MKKRTLALGLFLTLTSLSYGCASNIKKEKDVTSKVYEKVEKKYITDARAQWISRNTIAWKLPNYNRSYYDFSINYSPNADIIKKDGKILGGKSVKLKFKGPIEEGDPILAKYPYLKGYMKLDTSNIEQERLKPEILRSNIVISASNVNGELLDATQIQNYGVLDEIYNYTKNDLGLTFNRFNQPTLKIWAPTAKSVKVLFFNNPNDITPVKIRKLDEQVNEGVWTYSGVDEWIGMYYLYEVEVFSPLSGTVETNYVTDPYSLNLSANGKKSQIVSLDEPRVKPEGWDNLKKPDLESFTDISLYELHVRDFSIKDDTVSPQYRGKYMAFTEKNSNGMSHLKSLSKSGLTHVHLLPISDFSSVQEEESIRKEAQELYKYSSDSFEQQKAIGKLRDKDGYNWGYDPQHFLSPEGSYSTNPNGFERVLEMRSMVKSLNDVGLRVVMDVVFNHTSESKDGDKSVLDKIVPGYYYRLDENGNHQNSSCCPDLATEHKMAGKLMKDAVKNWAKNYKVDGFRFDLMGHNTIDNLQEIRKELDTLDPLLDGVDGKKIYLYGEGWKFGSLNDMNPEVSMNQVNSYGLGVGTFNDRIRDSLRGGNYSHDTKSDQGFLTGLYSNPNGSLSNKDTPATTEGQKNKLLNYTDNIKVGMAGNIKGFNFLSSSGSNIKSDSVMYRGSQATAYAKEPQETINYVSAHDNYILWDQITAKVPLKSTSNNDKVRIQNLGLSMIALSQGVPFFHAGDEILRSKSGDGDSYDSGDWFNAIDFSYGSNNWGIGLPPEWRNKDEWSFWKERLSMPELKVNKDNMLSSLSNFKRFLSIRKSSKLFRLNSSNEIKNQVSFLENETSSGTVASIPGVIAMYIEDKNNIDSNKKSVLSIFNANKTTIEFSNAMLKSKNMELAPQLLDNNVYLQKGSEFVLLPVDKQISKAKFNNQNGTITIPPYTSLVYFEKE